MPKKHYEMKKKLQHILNDNNKGLKHCGFNPLLYKKIITWHRIYIAVLYS